MNCEICGAPEGNCDCWRDEDRLAQEMRDSDNQSYREAVS